MLNKFHVYKQFYFTYKYTYLSLVRLCIKPCPGLTETQENNDVLHFLTSQIINNYCKNFVTNIPDVCFNDLIEQ